MLTERLHKYLARCGRGSRRACEELIRAGRVSVDGTVVNQMGYKIAPEKAEVRLDGERVRLPRFVYFLANKPRGTVSTSDDPQKRQTVLQLLPPSCTDRVYVVGRLDRESSGLVLLTNNGELAQRLTHPRYNVVKRYRIRVKGSLDAKCMERLKSGVWLAEGKTRAIEPRVISRDSENTVLEIDISHGTNRVLRRSLSKVGLKVKRLVRCAMGPLELGDLRPGQCRPLTQQEEESLLAVLDGRNLAPPRARSRANRSSGSSSFRPRSFGSGEKSRRNQRQTSGPGARRFSGGRQRQMSGPPWGGRPRGRPGRGIPGRGGPSRGGPGRSGPPRSGDSRRGPRASASARPSRGFGGRPDGSRSGGGPRQAARVSRRS